ncbi:MAG: amidohydrolase family protein, partial [Pseudomonadota bacterium]
MTRQRRAARRLGLLAMVLVAMPVAQGAAADLLVIDHVDVIPMDTERVLRDYAVVVRDGRIVRLAASGTLPIPRDAQTIDGRNRYLLPGLAEMHAHLPSPRQRGMPQRQVLDLFVANGITTIRSMLGDSQHLELRAAVATGATLGPRIVASGPSFSGSSVDGVKAVVERVRAQKAAGYDFLKVHPGLSRREFNALVEAASEAGIAFAGHVSVEVDLERVFAAGQASIDHLDGYARALLTPGADATELETAFFGLRLAPRADPERLALLARQTAAAGVWNVPTQLLIEHIAGTRDTEALSGLPEMRYVPAPVVTGWADARQRFLAAPGLTAPVRESAIALRRALIGALNNAGAGLLLGSDAPQVFNVPGFSAHRELELLVAAGLTPFEALATATV